MATDIMTIETELNRVLAAAYREDLGEVGDVTTDAIFAPSDTAEARIVAKSQGVAAGFPFLQRIIDAGRSTAVPYTARVTRSVADGARFSIGDELALISGSISLILRCERVVLNLLSLLSGIATGARRLVDLTGPECSLIDTRKTIPGLRLLSKYAVRVGGAANHRMGLHDMVLIKDNHIDGAGGITRAVERVRARHGARYRVEVECRTLEDVREAIDALVDIVLLDNMEPATIREAVRLRRGAVLFEASGGITEERISEYASAGVDRISVGALTHSVVASDFSMQIVPARADGGNEDDHN